MAYAYRIESNDFLISISYAFAQFKMVKQGVLLLFYTSCAILDTVYEFQNFLYQLKYRIGYKRAMHCAS